MGRQKISENTREQISLFLRQAERESEMPSERIKDIRIKKNKCCESWFDKPINKDLQVIKFSLKNTRDEVSDNAFLMVFEEGAGQMSYFLRYESTGRFSTKIHIQDKIQPLMETILLLLNKMNDGFLLKRDSFADTWTVCGFSVFEKRFSGWEEIFSAEI